MLSDNRCATGSVLGHDTEAAAVETDTAYSFAETLEASRRFIAVIVSPAPSASTTRPWIMER